ncbi:MAG: ATP-binding protein [Moorellales bacterium]
MAEPSWFREIVQKWAANVAHVFILYGNVDDLVAPGVYVKDYLLSRALVASREVVVAYDRSSGITFPVSPADRQLFLELVGLAQQLPPALAALGQGGETPLPAAPAQAFPLIERVLKLVGGKRGEEGGEGQYPKAALVIDRAETVLPNADIAAMSPEDRTVLVTVLRWAREHEFLRAGPPIFLLTENLGDLHAALRRASSRVEAVRIPYPGFEERRDFIRALAEARGGMPEGEVDRLAAQTAGLKLVHIEDIFLRADQEGCPVGADLVRQRKEEIVRSEFADLLEVMEPRFGFSDVGGLDHVKRFFERSVVRPMREGNAARVPMGVLLLGPPGTGKTLLAEAVAKESGMNCCSLNIGRLLGSYVGQSERNLERALECIKALAPTIVVVDEIDQSGLSREAKGDSGVSNRLLRRLMEFMGDPANRGKILWLGLSNRPDLLDPALKRPGRFDKKVPILAPEAAEREQIFRVMFRKYGLAWEGDFSAAVAATEGWTGAEIEALVLKAYEVADDQGAAVVTEAHLAEALERYFPTTGAIEEMTALAVAECNDADLLPPRYREKLRERRRPAAELRAEARKRRAV